MAVSPTADAAASDKQIKLLETTPLCFENATMHLTPPQPLLCPAQFEKPLVRDAPDVTLHLRDVQRVNPFPQFNSPSSSCPQAQRCVTELKAQVNRLEADVEEQRSHKQVAMVENEHLRMEVEALRCANVANVGAQIGLKEADGEYAASLWG